MTTPHIAVLTDFGSVDPYVGIMKGVIANIAPEVAVLDISHEIPPGDILRGALTLWQSAPYFPDGTVFLTVIDPGVGSHRRAIVLQSGPHTFVGPDNGLFTFCLEANARGWALTNTAYQLPEPSSTFHGRDIFAPAAAYLATGVNPADFGPKIDSPMTLPYPRLAWASETRIEGEIMYADHFGNLVTSLGRLVVKDEFVHFRPWLPDVNSGRSPLRDTHLELPDGRRLGWSQTFSDIPANQCAALVGSTGLVEISAYGQSAQQFLGLNKHDPVSLVMGD